MHVLRLKLLSEASGAMSKLDFIKEEALEAAIVSMYRDMFPLLMCQLKRTHYFCT
jgi:hypothetical protein